MTLFEIVHIFERIALTQPNVRSASNGNVYDIMNTNPSIRYKSFVVTQNTHYEGEDYDRYGLTLFMIDRLLDDMESNRLSIQSICKEQLGNIIRTFCEEFNCEIPDITYTPFTQKFVDECAGIYCNFTIEVFRSDCMDEYQPAYRPDIHFLQNKTVVIKTNGITEVVPDSAFDALSKVTVITDVTEECDRAYEEGMEDQKAKLETLEVTRNGEYVREDGYDKVIVNVPQSEPCPDIKLQSKTATENGRVTPDEGFDGLSEVNINVECPTCPEPTLKTLTALENGVYEPSDADGYNKVIVNVEHPAPILQTKTVTENGIVVPDEGYEGLDKVIVDVQSGSCECTEITLTGGIFLVNDYGDYCFTFDEDSRPTEIVFEKPVYCTVKPEDYVTPSTTATTTQMSMNLQTGCFCEFKKDGLKAESDRISSTQFNYSFILMDRDNSFYVHPICDIGYAITEIHFDFDATSDYGLYCDKGTMVGNTWYGYADENNGITFTSHTSSATNVFSFKKMLIKLIKIK